MPRLLWPKSLIESDGIGNVYVDVTLDNSDKGEKLASERMFDQAQGSITKCGKIVLK